MLFIQLLALIFFAYTLSRTIVRWRNRTISKGELFLWLGVWLFLGLVVLVPDLSTVVANAMGIGRGADFVLYVAVALLFYLVFRTYVVIERLEQQITQLVRQLALEDLEPEQATDTGSNQP